MPCLITGGYTLKLGNVLANLWKNRQNGGEFGQHSEIPRVGLLLVVLADVATSDFESSLAENELGRSSNLIKVGFN